MGRQWVDVVRAAVEVRREMWDAYLEASFRKSLDPLWLAALRMFTLS